MQEKLNCAGIYKITCSGNNKFYIGSAKCFRARFKEHRNNLRHNRHHSKYLQNCCNKYGFESLVFEIIEVIEDLTILLKREYEYIQNLNPECNSMREIGTKFKPMDSSYCERVTKTCREKAKNQISQNSTKTTGVRFSSSKNRFVAYITVKNKSTPLGSYLTFEKALKARQEGERVFWSDKYEQLTDEERSIVDIHNKLRRERTTNTTTGYKQISYCKLKKNFVVDIRDTIIGRYKTLEEALEARNSCYPKLPEHLTDLLLNI